MTSAITCGYFIPDDYSVGIRIAFVLMELHSYRQFMLKDIIFVLFC